MNLPDQILRRVEDKVLETCLRAQTLYGRTFELPAIEWNLRGLRAGCAHGLENRIRLNPILLSENTEDFIAQTVPHEIAHLVNRALNGPCVQPHGPEWQSIMHAFGLPALRCHQYKVTTARIRAQHRHVYHCNCRAHSVSQIMHNRIRRGWTYSCRRCGGPIKPGASSNLLPNPPRVVKTKLTDERELLGI